MRITFFRHNPLFIRAIGWCLLLHFINFSIDLTDGAPGQASLNTGRDEIETLSELVYEAVVEMEDGMPDHEEGGDRESRSTTAKVFTLPPLFADSPCPQSSAVLYFSFNDPDVGARIREVVPPPPWA